MQVPREKRLGCLDGIRGWAAFMVLASHLLCGVFANLIPLSKLPLLDVFLDGHMAVFVFFVLSGFALTTKFVERPGAHSVTQAVAARYFRLAPPIALVSVAAFLLMKLHLMFNVQAAVVAHFETWLGLFYTFKPGLLGLIKFVGYNVFFHYEPNHGYNSNLWTMPIEFQGSMLVFSIVAVFVTSARRHFLTLPIAAAAGIFLMQMPTLACFIFGYVLAECFHSSWRSHAYVRYLAPALLPLVIAIKTLYPYYATPDALDAVLAAAIVFSVVFTSRYASLCSSRLSAFMGQISFPLYLVQIPLICSYTSFLLVKLHAQGLPIYQIALIDVTSTTMIALLIAWLMVPVERFSVRFSARAGAFLVRALSIPREAPTVAPTAAPESRRQNA